MNRPMLALAAATTVAYGALVVLDANTGTLRGPTTSTTVTWCLFAFVIFCVAGWWNERRPATVTLIWSAAVLFRVVVAFTQPTLSDDVYRYLWEGHVATQGVSPYSYSINDEALDHIAIPARDLSNNQDLASPYLPTAHAVFTSAALMLPSEPWVMQTIMISFELAAAALLSMLLVACGIPKHRMLLYLWNPLVVVEISHGAHVDALMLMLVCAALAATFHPPSWLQRWWIAPVALAAATLTRPLPLVLLPVVWFIWQSRQRALYVAATIVAIVPFGLASGWGLSETNNGTGVFGSAREYSETFEFNNETFHWIRTIAEAFSSDSASAGRVIVAIIVIAMFGVATTLARQRTEPLDLMRIGALMLGTYVVLTPILQPWYLVMLAAWLPLLAPTTGESRVRWLHIAPWGWLMATVGFSYLTYSNPSAFGELVWVRRLEWYPTYILLMFAGAMTVFTARTRVVADETLVPSS